MELCRAALALVARDSRPELWAALQVDLAVSLSENPLGSRAQNLEQAIYHYRQALEVYTRQAFAYEWALMQNNLGYCERIRGEGAENLEQAIYHHRQALEVYTHQTFAYEWAMSQNNLGQAYRDRIRGERAENLEQAIYHHHQALEVYTRQAFPEEWAHSQNNLAIAYLDRIRGSRTENVEQAIFHSRQALEVRTRQAFASEWAMSQNNLGEAYRNRIRGSRTENLEQAIYHFRQGLEVYTRQAFPSEWATSQHNLATAYLYRIREERAENLELAIFHFRQALEVRTRQAFPQQWALAQNNLAIAYRNRIRGSRAENLEQAIWLYRQALEVYTHQAFPYEWARSQNNLANAYGDRIRGERAENLEQAIFHFRQSLQVYTRQAFPFEWARSQNNLATAYLYRIRGQWAENLELAIFHCHQALEVWTHQAFPEQWAGSQNNLANAYLYRIREEPAENVEQAVEQAIFHYRQTLEVYTRQAFPEQWAKSQNNLATAYRNHIRGSRTENVEQAILHYGQALDVYTPQSFPQDCRNTAYWLGHLLYDEGRFTEARPAFVTAHQAVEALRGEVKREAARRQLAEENADLYARLVYCCLHDANVDQEAAFEYAAAGKGRAFVDLLATAHFDLSAAGADDPAFAADWQKYRELRQQIDALRVNLTGGRGTGLLRDTNGAKDGERLSPAVLRSQLDALREQASALWEEMSFKYPALTATQNAPSLSVKQARELAGEVGATLVEYYRHDKGWCAFIVTPDGVRYVPLPQVDDALLKRMGEWLKGIESGTGRGLLSCRQPLYKWHDAIIAPLREGLPQGGEVILAPFGALHLLPLAAARHPLTKRYLAEDYTLAFAPSLGALRVALDQAQRTRLPLVQASDKLALLSVVYPGLPEWKDHSDPEVSRQYLDNVLPEAEAIARRFSQVKSLTEDAATPNAVVASASEQDLVHFGCHGDFDLQRPQESGLMLAGGWLTVQQIITELRLKQTHLVTLAACVSGRAAVRTGDEYVGLMQSVMTAGANSVVATLWSVNDPATRALFEAFYANLMSGQPPAVALREASQRVREQSRWKHPYYWAAFTVSGLAHGPVGNRYIKSASADF